MSKYTKEEIENIYSKTQLIRTRLAMVDLYAKLVETKYDPYIYRHLYHNTDSDIYKGIIKDCEELGINPESVLGRLTITVDVYNEVERFNEAHKEERRV